MPDAPTALRRHLHAHPEVSGAEHRTHDAVRDFVARSRPTRLLEHLAPAAGGTGLAAVFDSASPGPTVLVRAELDALPIHERSGAPHASTIPGVMHACGHDGHAATVAALAECFARRPPPRGRVVLLFQPAEETGAGAAAVLADPRWPQIEPDVAIALHNLPGYDTGTVVLREGVFSCASRGMAVRLEGRTTHSAHPRDGLSPAPALAAMIDRLPRVSGAALPARFGLITITHARTGVENAFGIAPGDGLLNAVVRAETDEDLASLAAAAEREARRLAHEAGLPAAVTWHEDFAAARCDAPTVGVIRDAARAAGLPVVELDHPFRWSEDFGRFTIGRPGVLFGLGSGRAQPQLHNPDFDYPDALLPIGTDLFERAVRALLA